VLNHLWKFLAASEGLLEVTKLDGISALNNMLSAKRYAKFSNFFSDRLSMNI
jgi:hypothetical protein